MTPSHHDISQYTDDECIAIAAIQYGVKVTYYDYGHPERQTARKYWTARDDNGRAFFGYSKVGAVRGWLRIHGGYFSLVTGLVTGRGTRAGRRAPDTQR